METDFKDSMIRKMLGLLEETFIKPIGFYLEKETSYNATLEKIDCALASKINPATNESIAGHVFHVILSLRYLQDYIASKDTSQYDWGKDWNARVNAEQWESLQRDLLAEYGRMKAFIQSFGAWFEGQNMEILMGSIAHCALHLGMIRQIKDF